MLTPVPACPGVLYYSPSIFRSIPVFSIKQFISRLPPLTTAIIALSVGIALWSGLMWSLIGIDSDTGRSVIYAIKPLLFTDVFPDTGIQAALDSRYAAVDAKHKKALDALTSEHDDALAAMTERAEHETKGCCGFALTLAGMDDDETFFFRLGGKDFFPGFFFLAHLVCVASIKFGLGHFRFFLWFVSHSAASVMSISPAPVIAFSSW